MHHHVRWGVACARRVVSVLALAVAAASAAPGGGTPENILLIVDPTNAESLYVGNYYRQARNIPASNVLYMYPGAADYQSFGEVNIEAVFGHIRNLNIASQVDYIVITPGSPFYVGAPGLINDSCWPVERFSITGAYTTAFIRDEVLGGLPVTTLNRYYSTSDQARGFDSESTWYLGSPSTDSRSRRYFISAMLGYSGERGNTIQEILDNIDRSVGADDTRPGGVFYFMNNQADPPRNVRAPQFPAVVNAIVALGGSAVILNQALPGGQLNCLGIMTGAAEPDIINTNLAFLPGAFADHLTSWAATFDIEWQTKVSEWIAKGASGSWGAVEEPCNYTGKFPHARMHLFYFQGLSLGEAAFRSAAYVPFQSLLYGDPMTRTWSYLPIVTVNGAPAGPVSGVISFTPNGSTNRPGVSVSQYEVLVDGVRIHTGTLPQQVSLDTTRFADGWHDLRVLVYEVSLNRSVGRWTGELIINNLGRSAAVTPSATAGDLSTAFSFDLSSAGGSVSEIRLVSNSRVVAAGPGGAALLTVYGGTLGGGPVQVQAEALFDDGMLVRSAPVELDIAFSGAGPADQPPQAFGFTRRVLARSPFLIELPATSNQTDTAMTYELITPPAQATIPAGQSGAQRLMQPLPGASGSDSFTFQATNAAGASNIATVTLIYDACADLTGDRVVDFSDLVEFLANYGMCEGDPLFDPLVDLNQDGCVSFGDLVLLLAEFGRPCS